MCHDPSWRKPTAQSALMKIHLGEDPLDLNVREMKKIEEEHGPDWYKKLGLEENPLYHNSSESELNPRKVRW